MTNALIVVLALISQAPAEEDGRFSIGMPTGPERREVSVPTPNGPSQLCVYLAAQKDAVYCVTYADYPEGFVAKNDPRAMLAGCQQSTVAQFHAKVTGESEIELDGHPGREFDLDFPADGGPFPGGAGKARVSLVGNRLYQLQVMGKKEQVGDPATDRYLDSFKPITSKGPADTAKHKPRP